MGIYTELRKEYPRTWRIWYRMNKRCEIGEKGFADVEVCDEWNREVCGEQGFIQFLDDMGPREHDNGEITRIDMHYNYTPGNCDWVTDRRITQSRKRLYTTPYGQLLKLGKSKGIHPTVIWQWKKAGYDILEKIKNWQPKCG